MNISRRNVHWATAAKPRSAGTKRAQRGVAMVAIGAMVTLAAACGGSSDSDGGSAKGAADSAAVADAEAAVAKNRAGTDRALPVSAPKPQAGQNVWVISCTQSAEGCSVPAAGAKEAGQLLGWDVTVFDGKFSPDTLAEGIRSAIADKADAIVLVAVDCMLVKGPVEEAKKAGVKIYGVYAMDCDDPLGGGGEPLYDAELLYNDGMTFQEFSEGPLAQSTADYIIAETKGEAKIIEFTQNDVLLAKHLGKGFEARIKECSSCEVVATVPVTFNDLVSGKLQAKTEAALSRYPQANVVYGLSDTGMILGISQAVLTSGRNDDLLVTGAEGLSPNVGFVRENKGQDFIAGSPANWLGWAAIDGVNRMLQDEPQVDSGIGVQTLDGTGPLPTKTSYYDGNIDADGNPKVDYVAHYKKIWAVS